MVCVATCRVAGKAQGLGVKRKWHLARSPVPPLPGRDVAAVNVTTTTSTVRRYMPQS